MNEFRNKRIIIADDVVDTGHTIKKLLDILKKIVCEFRIVVVFKKDTSIIDPDYYWKETPGDKWISFPWSSLKPVEGKGALITNE